LRAPHDGHVWENPFQPDDGDPVTELPDSVAVGSACGDGFELSDSAGIDRRGAGSGLGTSRRPAVPRSCVVAVLLDRGVLAGGRDEFAVRAAAVGSTDLVGDGADGGTFASASGVSIMPQ